MSLHQRATVLGFDIDVADKATVVSACVDAVTRGHHTRIVTANPEMLMRASNEANFAAVLRQVQWVIPDGAGVVWALNVLHNRCVPRLPGIELSEALVATAAQQGWQVALVGGAPSIAQQASDTLTQRFPGLTVALVADGFGDLDAVAADIQRIKPQLVLAALGVPQQEYWLQSLLAAWPQGDGLGCIGVGVGGSFDVWSGTKKRAPALFCNLNLEWLYRITSEPWRISRVAKPLPLFVWRVVQQKLGWCR